MARRTGFATLNPSYGAVPSPMHAAMHVVQQRCSPTPITPQTAGRSPCGLDLAPMTIFLAGDSGDCGGFVSAGVERAEVRGQSSRDEDDAPHQKRRGDKFDPARRDRACRLP